MKASDFFKSRGKPAPSHPVTLRLVDEDGTEQRFVDAAAVFRFVSDRRYSEASSDAAKALVAATHVTDEVRRQREQAHFLHAALRDKEAPASPFFDSVEDCAAMLVPAERYRLLAEYQAFVDANFPEVIKPEDFKAFEEDARAFFFAGLLSKYGLPRIRLVLASLAVASGTSQTP